jgi:hypothetical protein
LAEAGARCVPRRRPLAASPRKSIFRAAKECADTSLPYAFLG